MVEFRFYLFSLIAVFLALGTGMIIGSALPGNEILVEKQQVIMGDLQREFTVLRQRERALNQRVADLETRGKVEQGFAAEVVPFLVRGRLEGRRVALVTSGETANTYAAQVAATLGMAGAIVTPLRIPPPESPRPGRSPGSLEERWRELGVEAARTLLAAPDAPLAGVLFLALPADRPETIRSLITGAATLLRPAGVTLVGGESWNARPSAIPVFMKLGLSTVDAADLAPGQVGLVLLLAGAQGHYGVKDTARGLLPELFRP